MSFLKMELIPFVRRWQENFSDDPVYELVKRVDIDGLWVNPGDSPEKIAETLAAFADGHDLTGAVLRRIENAKAFEGTDDELDLYGLLLEEFTETEWDEGWI